MPHLWREYISYHHRVYLERENRGTRKKGKLVWKYQRSTKNSWNSCNVTRALIRVILSKKYVLNLVAKIIDKPSIKSSLIFIWNQQYFRKITRWGRAKIRQNPYHQPPSDERIGEGESRLERAGVSWVSAPATVRVSSQQSQARPASSPWWILRLGSKLLSRDEAAQCSAAARVCLQTVITDR